MEEMYYISLIGRIDEVLSLILISCVCVFVLLLFLNYTRELAGSVNKAIKWLGIATLVIIPLYISCPSKKDLYMIYGVGQFIDAAQKQGTNIPEKTIKLIDKAMCDYLRERGEEK